MNSIMGHMAVEANAFYRHKKFDQAKRTRADSFSSTSSDGELRNDLEIERKIHPFLTQISNVNLSHINWPVLETKSKRNHTEDCNTDQQLPAAKRSCNFSVAFNTDHCESSAKRPQSFTASTNTQLQQANILSALEKGFKRKFTPDGNTNQQLPLAKRPCGNSSIASNTDQYVHAISTSDQHLSPAQRPYTSNVISNSNQHVPLTHRNCTSTVTSNCDKYVAPAQGLNTSYVSTRMPALEKEAERNLPAVAGTDQNMPPPTRPRSFSASISRPAYPLPYLTQLPLNNMPLALTKPTKTSLTPAASANQHDTDQYMAPPTRPRSFSASISRPAYPFPYLTQVPLNNMPLASTKPTKTSLTPAASANQHDTDQYMAPPTRPRSFSASISRPAYPFPYLTQVPLNNMPLASTKPTKTSLTPAASANQHATIKSATTGPQKPCAYTLTSASDQHMTPVPGSRSTSFTHLTHPGMANILPDLAKEPKTNFAAALNTDQDITPVTRQRSFSTGTGSLAYSMQPQWTNTSLTLKKQRGLTPASNTAQLQSSAQTPPLNFSAGTRSRSSSFGVANSLSSSNMGSKRSFTTAFNADHNIAPATRPRSYSASTSSSTSSFASLKQLCRANISVSPPVIPPTAAILPKISHETLRNICKYHGNMVRKFPKKERTPKDQERRNKNTIACRMSRRVKKLEHIALEEQYKEFTQQTFEIMEKSMRATAYLHELMKLCKSTEGESESPAELSKTESLPVTAQEKKPFTIAFLAGTEEK